MASPEQLNLISKIHRELTLTTAFDRELIVFTILNSGLSLESLISESQLLLTSQIDLEEI